MAEITPAGPGYDEPTSKIAAPKTIKPHTGFGNTKNVPMPTSSYGADFSSGFKMTPDFTLDLKAKDWESK